MRSAPILALALLVGCDDLGEPPVFDTGPTTSASACPTAGWVEPSSASLVVTSLGVDGIPLVPGFDAAAEYDSGPSTCISSDGQSATWTFTVAGVPYGTIRVAATQTGNVDLQTGDITFDLFGADPPVTFTGADFVQGALVVDSLSPLEVTFSNGEAQKDGRFLSIVFNAQASP